MRGEEGEMWCVIVVVRDEGGEEWRGMREEGGEVRDEA